MNQNSRIYIAGHTGLVGSAILNTLQKKKFTRLIYRTHKELELTCQKTVADFFTKEKPEYVILAAGKVGGISANSKYRADFIYVNSQIQNNIIHQSYLHGVKKLLFLGSTCIYPKNAPQPLKEETLLSSPLEYSNEPYAIAKISGIKMCESYNLQYGTNYISVMPTNLYGPNDNFDLENSHVLPALIRKIHLARLLSENLSDLVLKDLKLKNMEQVQVYLKKYGVNADAVEIWGSGTPRREFLYSEDMANACEFVLENINFKNTYSENQTEIRNTHLNIGTGKDISIKELGLLIKTIVGFKGALKFNADRPDGTPIKLTDPSKLSSLGWTFKTGLEEGIKKTYAWYLQNLNKQ